MRALWAQIEASRRRQAGGDLAARPQHYGQPQMMDRGDIAEHLPPSEPSRRQEYDRLLQQNQQLREELDDARQQADVVRGAGDRGADGRALPKDSSIFPLVISALDIIACFISFLGKI